MKQPNQQFRTIVERPQKQWIKRLLLLTNRLPVSADDAASPFVIDFIAALQQQGVEVEVFTPKIGRDSGNHSFPLYRFDWGEENSTLSELPLWKPESWRKIKTYFWAGRECLLEHLRQHRYDHLLALWALPSGWFAYQAQIEFDIPYSIWTLGSDINVWAKRPFAGGRIRHALRSAAALFADGDELAEKVKALCDRDCHFLPSLRRLPNYEMSIRRENYFLYLGRIEKRKGVFDLLKAFAKIKKNIWDYRLIYLGEGSALKQLDDKIKAYHLRGKVHTLGRVPTDEIVSYLARARGLVIPTHSDSIPLVFGEALQTKTPMIVTNVGDLGNLVRDNRLGYTVQKKRPRQLTDAMIKLIMTEIDVSKQAEKLLAELAPEAAARKFLEITSA